MLLPLKMKRVALQVLSDDAALAALVLAECGSFNPETASVLQKQLPEFPGEHYRDLYRSAQSYLDRILANCTLFVGPIPHERVRHVPEAELAETEAWLQQVWAKCSECQEGLRRIDDEHKHIDQLLGTLDKFKALDIDLALLQRSKTFLDVRLGTVPVDNLKRLEEALSLTGFLLTPFITLGATAQVIAAGHTGKEGEIDAVLQAAGWRTLEIPPEFRDTPENVREQLLRRREQVVEENATQCRTIELTHDEYKDRLIAAAHTLLLAAPLAELGESLRGRGALTLISGWVPAREMTRLQDGLRQRLQQRFVLTARDPLPEEHGQVPSALRHPRILHSFNALVRNYGVPRYGEFDPTVLFALSFVAMFGMMFGDVGHGAVIVIGGVLLHRKIKIFTTFVVTIGLSSMLFGALYGSVFGFEELLHPLWMAPLSDPNRMLTLALYWGIGFILIATAITIRNRLVEGHVLEALLDGKGLAGMLFYLGVLYGAYQRVAHGRFGLLETVLVIAPLGAILGYKWHENRIPLGERILVVLIEGFETVMAYIANTLSFLRVAAFSLNHVALAIAVFTLANMMGQTGHWITVVLGNIFILVMEGAIVAIQVLRLEYYEGFSRFFSGDGREYLPLKLRTSQGV
jgi:V/A-type H+/Na+-transporting ATPase subunit I